MVSQKMKGNGKAKLKEKESLLLGMEASRSSSFVCFKEKAESLPAQAGPSTRHAPMGAHLSQGPGGVPALPPTRSRPVRHRSARRAAAGVRGERSSVRQTKATFTPSAVDTVRTQFLSKHDTNGAAILLVS